MKIILSSSLKTLLLFSLGNIIEGFPVHKAEAMNKPSSSSFYSSPSPSTFLLNSDTYFCREETEENLNFPWDAQESVSRKEAETNQILPPDAASSSSKKPHKRPYIKTEKIYRNATGRKGFL